MAIQNITKSVQGTLDDLIQTVGKVECEGMANTFYQRHYRAIIRAYDFPGSPFWLTSWKNATLSIHNGHLESAINVAVMASDAQSVLDIKDLIRMNLKFSRDDFSIEITLELNTEGMDENQRQLFASKIESMYGFTRVRNTTITRQLYTLDIVRTYSTQEREQARLTNSRYWSVGGDESNEMRMDGDRFYRVSKFYSGGIRYSHVHRSNVFVFIPDQPEALLEQLLDPDFFKDNKIKITDMESILSVAVEAAQSIPYLQPEKETIINL